jgi:hypothetical protein
MTTSRAHGRPGGGLVRSALDCPALVAAARSADGPPPPDALRCGLPGGIRSVQGYAADSSVVPPGTLAPGAAVPAAGPDEPPLFSALQEQLGLRLSAARAPIEVLVVDRVTRPTPD